MDRIKFSVNGRECSVGAEVSSDVALVDYLREFLELRGTKYMCREGGCGACVVAVTAKDPHTGQPRTFSVNSCLPIVAQCQDWEITTIEEIGNRLKGYHPIQKSLAENNGSQCGYCSVGWVMSMYSLLKSRNNEVTQYEVEDSFGSNTCRCTGYRPILKAFKSFAKDAPKVKGIADIEDLKICNNRVVCVTPCEESDWCLIAKDEIENKIIKVHLKDDKIWCRVKEVKQIFEVLNEEGYDSYMLIAGNTGRGVVHIFEYPRVLIDIASVSELQQYTLDQNLVLGAGTALTDALRIFKELASERDEFKYLQKFYDHWLLVAHIPVRNIGTLGGNLMLKHNTPTFASDIFLLLETVGATVTIMDRTAKIVEVTPKEFTRMDMVGKVIINVMLPPLSENYEFVSYKIMPRYQNAHAQVNAAFLYEFKPDKKTIISARIVMGGLSERFVHAEQTEKFLIGKNLFTNEVLQAALKVLDSELIVEPLNAEMKPEFRKKLALGLFYKAKIALIPREQLDPRYLSGNRDFRKSRPVSTASEVYDTNPLVYPITEPSPKVEALIQCAGEAKYANDLPKQPQEVFAAFVTAKVGTGEILSMDPAPALKLQGVLAFYTAKDIPGVNSFMPSNVPYIVGTEEMLCSGKIMYYDQAIGIIVAENDEVANRAAALVDVKYKANTEPPMLTINDVKERDPSRISVFAEIAAKDKGKEVFKVIKGSENIYSQYFFTMEPHTCVARPAADGIEILPSSQWMDTVHAAVSEVLNLEQNRVDISITRVGGGFGSKLTRSLQSQTACAMVSYLMNRPCRFVMHIQANMRICGKRQPCTRDFEVGVNSSGEIQYIDYQLYTDNGYVFAEPIVALIAECIPNVYDSKRWQYKVYNVLTDTASNTWCRSPGTLEAIVMAEYVMEHISYALNMDPLEVRMKNINSEDTPLMEILTTIVEDSEYHKRKLETIEFNKTNRWKKRGIRIALMSWANLVLADHQILLSVYHVDGTVAISHGGIEIGQGLNTKVIQTVAYTLKISKDKVKVKPNDLLANPNSTATGGSSTSESCCIGAIKCCQQLLERLKPIKDNLGEGASWVDIIRAAFLAGVNLQASYHTTAEDIAKYVVAGAAIAEVELDVLTGESEVRRVDLVIDAGTSLNPEIDIGQVEGGFIMGMGYWTSEHLIYDKNTGELQTDRSFTYKVPLAKDIPLDFRVQLKRNSYNPDGVLGARAINEASTCLPVCVAFALRAAIAASREDSGYSTSEWFDVDGPYTLEQNVLTADVHLSEFVYSRDKSK